MATISRTMTEAEFLALPDVEGLHRELIRGELREGRMTTRYFPHSLVVSNVAYRLRLWLGGRPAPRGCVVSGQARVKLRGGQPTLVGVDVAYLEADAKPASPRTAKFVDGPPRLVVEVLSPRDQHREIAEKVSEYLDAGVPHVWILDPDFSLVIVHRSDAKPQLFNADQEITAEPDLPGLRLAVADLFEGLDD